MLLEVRDAIHIEPKSTQKPQKTYNYRHPNPPTIRLYRGGEREGWPDKWERPIRQQHYILGNNQRYMLRSEKKTTTYQAKTKSEQLKLRANNASLRRDQPGVLDGRRKQTKMMGRRWQKLLLVIQKCSRCPIGSGVVGSLTIEMRSPWGTRIYAIYPFVFFWTKFKCWGYSEKKCAVGAFEIPILALTDY